jgi:hypothetical protein
MNYDEARQLGKDSEAPGKWNWSSMNDRVIRTASPCAYPDYQWPVHFDVLNPPTPTGRERCDHDTREEAERHYYDAQVHGIRMEQLDLDSIRERRRCAVAECPNWEEWRAHWPGGYSIDSLCQQHHDRAASLHPFVPDLQVIHS